MRLNKGDIIEVHHSRKGRFTAMVFENFDTDERMFWPVATLKAIEGASSQRWGVGEEIPCKGSLVLDYQKVEVKEVF